MPIVKCKYVFVGRFSLESCYTGAHCFCSRKKECGNCRHTLYMEESNEFWSNLYIFAKAAVSQKIAFIKKQSGRCFSFISELFIGWEQCCSKVLNSSSSRVMWSNQLPRLARGGDRGAILPSPREQTHRAVLSTPTMLAGTRAQGLFSTSIQELCFEIFPASYATWSFSC